jgi:hypothetical protein
VGSQLVDKRNVKQSRFVSPGYASRRGTLAIAALAMAPLALAVPATRNAVVHAGAAPEALPQALTSSKPVRVERGGRPLPEILEALSGQAGLRLKVGDELLDQKATVVFAGTPLVDAATALADCVDGVWRTREKAGEATEYRLEGSKRRTEHLNSYRRARAAAAAARDRAAEATLRHVLSQPPSDGPRGELSYNPEPLFPLLRSLPDAALRAWIDGGNDAFTVINGFGPDKTPAVVIPGAALDGGQRASLSALYEALAEEAIKAGGNGDLGRALARHPEAMRLELWSQRADLREGLTLDLWIRIFSSGSSSGGDFRLGSGVSGALPDPLEDLSDLAPAGAERTRELEKTKRLDLLYGPARMDRALIEIARAAGISLAAEYYTEPGAFPLISSQLPLERVLRDAETLYHLVHFCVGGTLVVRCRDWRYRCDREPFGAIVDLLEEQKQHHGALSLDDYIAAASVLDDPRLPALRNHQDEHGSQLFLREAPRLAAYRNVLRGCAGLTPAERAALASEQGLALAALSPPELARWQRALRPFMLLLTPEAMRTARIRVTPSAPGYQGIPSFLLEGVPDLEPVPLASDPGG